MKVISVPSKVFLIFRIARQIEGDYIFIQVEKAFTSEDPEKAELKAIKYVNSNPCPAFEEFKVENNMIPCSIERGIVDFDLTEDAL